MSTTEETTETAEVVEETVELQEAEGWKPPLLQISKTTSIGETTQTIRVELAEGGPFPTSGDVTAFAAAVVEQLDGGERTPAPRFELTVSPLSPEKAKSVKSYLESRLKPKPVDELQEQLARAEAHEAECPGDHSGEVDRLRALVKDANRSKDVADAAAAAAADAEKKDGDA
jgi:hypothetical protein